MSNEADAPSTLARALGLVFLAIVAVVTVAALTPPPALGNDAPAGEFSATRAIDAARAILRGPRPVGSEESERTRARLVERMRELGLEVDVQTATACGRALDWRRCAAVKNVVARLRGTASSREAVALFAHYDTVPNTIGAADDGAGVATLLETARALRAGAPLAHDVIFVFDDGEEPAMLGAIAFVREHPWRGDVRVALNFEARGTSGVSAMFDSSKENGALVRAFAAAAPRPISNSLTSALSRALPNDTDGSVFKAHDVPMLNFAFIDGFENYHRATDSFETLDARSVQHHGSYAVALARALAGGSLDDARAPPRVWFDVLGRFVVAYSPITGATLTIAAIGMFAAACKRARASLRGVAKAFGWAWLALLLTVVASAAAASLVNLSARWMIVVANGRVAVLPHVAIAVAIGCAVVARARKTIAANDIALGALAVPLFGAAITAPFAPGAGFLFHVPAFFLAAGALASTARISPAVRFAIACVAAAPGVYFFANLAFTAQLMAGGATPSLAAACVTLLLVHAWSPLAHAADRVALRRASFASLAAALALALVAVAILRSDRTTPRADSVVYALDADAKKGAWISYDAVVDPYTRQFLGDAPRPLAMPSFDPWSWPVFVADAPATLALAPDIAIVRDENDGDARRLSLRVRSPRGARCVMLFEAAGTAIARVRVDGRETLDFVHTSSLEMDRRLWYLTSSKPPRDAWNVDVCGYGSDGFLVELEAPRGARLELHAVDRSDGLPDIVRAAPREPGLIASQLGEATLVTKRFDL
jgi:hypothetical protein